MRRRNLFFALLIPCFLLGYFWKPIAEYFLNVNAFIGLLHIVIAILWIIIEKQKHDIQMWKNSYNEIKQEKRDSRSAAHQIYSLRELILKRLQSKSVKRK